MYVFPLADSVISGYGFMVVCKVTHFEFGIGGTDIVGLLNKDKQLVDSIELTGEGSETKTMQRALDGTGEWGYSERIPRQAQVRATALADAHSPRRTTTR